MKTATKNVKKAAPKTAAKKAPAPKKAMPKVEAKKPATLVDPRIAEKAKALDAAVAKLATPGLKATRKEAPKPGAKPEPKKARKMGALDAAAIVLADAGKPMRSKDLIAEMAKRGLWTSPGGKTPEATLYAAILREIGAKGTAARFARAGKGEFASTKTGGA
ncbi:MAG: winged helix-turn-helix domain-containing protein [Phycisphaerales bacterium]